MLLYNSASSIASDLYDYTDGKPNMSTVEISNYLSSHFSHEEEANDYDISNIWYAYQDLVMMDIKNSQFSSDEDDDRESNASDASYRTNSYSSDSSYDSDDYSGSYQSGGLYSSRSSFAYKNQTSYSRRRKSGRFLFPLLGIFLVFQVIVMLSDSITWENLIADLTDPDEIILNVIGLAIFCPIGLGVGAILQFLYESIFE